MATNSWNKLTWHWQKSILYWLNSRFFDLNGFSLSLWIISYDTLNLLAMVHVGRIKSGSIRRVKVEKETYRRICTCLECFLISKCYLSQLWRWVKTQIGDLQIEYSFLLFIAQWVRVQIQLWLVHINDWSKNESHKRSIWTWRLRSEHWWYLPEAVFQLIHARTC